MMHEETFAQRISLPARIDDFKSSLLIMNHYIHDQVHWHLHFHVSLTLDDFCTGNFFLCHDISTTLQKPSQKWKNVQMNLSINKLDVFRINPALFGQFAMIQCNRRVLVAFGSTEECLVQQSKHSMTVNEPQTLWINKEHYTFRWS